jgi:crotonobetainyl-CoA:carnitine CoA-transferase CaiB-like acyl-CoA transferase
VNSEKQNKAVSTPGISGPLSGIKVLDLSSVVFATFATQILGDLGADVVKVESPSSADGQRKGGDIMRWGGQQPSQSDGSWGPLFLAFNRNKRSIAFDLRNKDDHSQFHRLLAHADVFISNVRMNSLAKLGLDYASLAPRYPRLIYAHASGYGQQGPYADQPAYDDLIQALSGTTDLLKRSSLAEAPQYLPALLADKTSGLYLSNSILAALLQRERDGTAQFVEVPMLECFTHFTMSENLYGHSYVPATESYGYDRVLNAFRKPYACKTGYLAVVPYSDEQWRRFFELAGRLHEFDERFQRYQQRVQHITVLYEMMTEIMLERDAEQWLAQLRALDIPVMPVNALDQVIDDEHIKSVDLFQYQHHEQLGTTQYIRHPVRYSAHEQLPQGHPPGLGEHQEEVLSDWCGGVDKKLG